MTDPQMGCHQRLVRDDIVRLLQRGMVEDLEDARCRFVPRRALIDIINSKQVEKLLHATCTRADDHENREPLAEVARRIVPEAEVCLACNSGDCTGGRSVFAILLLIGKEEVVPEVFSEGASICDQILPFRSTASNAILSPKCQYNASARGFHRLDTKDRELIGYYQWQVISPSITTLSPSELQDLRHKKWDREMSLPWKELKRLGEPGPVELSIVHKARIYEGNHQLGGDGNSFFAVKTFKEWQHPGSTGKRFAKELRGNIRAPSHDRIVPLLSAFQHRESFILIFPWAHGKNLTEFWEENPHVSSGDLENRFSETWLLEECLGIADAIAAIHGLKGDSQPGVLAQIHADIKPENILCFDCPNPTESPVTLKIADFGEANVIERTKNSQGMEVEGAKVMHTATYRPPEHNPEEPVHLNYDVWCLGCFYLDFITWFLLGLTGLEDFDEDRLDEQDDPEVLEAKGNLSEDIFFKKTKRVSVPRRFRSLGIKFNSRKSLGAGRAGTAYSVSVTASVRTVCKLKDTVISHIEALKEDPGCGNSLVKFLHFIKTKMLVIDPKSRVQSNEVCNYLESLQGSRSHVASNGAP